MKCLSSLVILIVCLGLYSCDERKNDIYMYSRQEMESINKIPLYTTYLVPVDSLGKYVNEEIILPTIYDHCQLITDTKERDVYVFAYIYFDNTGTVRKIIKRTPDGGDLCTLAYYDKQGNITHAVYACGGENHGRLYSDGNSKMYIEYSFADTWAINDFLTISKTTAEFADRHKVVLEMPKNCKSVTFATIQKGDKAFLCANHTYAEPHGNVINKNSSRFGSAVLIDTVVDGWAGIKNFPFDKSIEYVSGDSLELMRE